ncbi:MAG: DUF5110 domain-containing protein [Alistipes sp.]|nr:DUF5110 domain-containing protein [Alistipes sp.]
MKLQNLLLGLMALVLFVGCDCATEKVAKENPKANEKAVVVAGNARFTVLTSQMIRMEWAEDGKFEDNATLTFVNRNLPVPEFIVEQNDAELVIKTADVTLTYVKGAKFSAENLKAEFALNGEKVTWTYGDDESANLMGTTRTLDQCDGWNLGKEPMEKGILSRAGWSIVDDSANHLLVDVDSHWKKWVECRPEGDRQDLYLFAYGHEYTKALKDYTKVAGDIPLPPKYMFGYWWSRYWMYSDSEFRDLVGQIKRVGIPIDVLIVDMDWHETWSLRRKDAPLDKYGQRIGWTGYTWKPQLFPSPKNFLSWVHSQDLKTALNLHPASGIEPFEEPYERFTKAYGWDQPGEGVPYRMSEQKWADAYFDTVLGPMEEDGVDFWWLDWQQWRKSKYVKNLSNTFWLNHTFNHHAIERNPEERPVIYHRWGGLGSHRYQVGFSGDIFTSWESLSFLPWFTATASNVGYGYWGHDIGGHMFRKGDSVTDPELYTRWLQYGVFTPIYKTHSTRDPRIERRVWAFPNHMFEMGDAIRLRYDLAPYIYTAARQTFDTGVSMCRPMYYYWPELDEAYDMKEQFMFGDDILATAVCKPVDPVTGLAEREMWFPEGQWFDCSTGAMYDGNQKVTLHYTLAENPYFAKAGAIIPMNPSTVKNLQEVCDELVLTVIPGGDGEASLYEDNGMSANYAEEYAMTTITKKVNGNVVRVVIEAREGNYEGALAERSYEVRFPAHFPPKSVKVNGKEYAYNRLAGDGEWTYDGYTLAPIVNVPKVSCGKKVVVELTFDEEAMAQQPRLYGKQGIFRRFVALTPLCKLDYGTNFDRYAMLPDAYLNVSQCPNYIMEHPFRITEWLDKYDGAKDQIVPTFEEIGTFEPELIEKIREQLKY